MPLRTITYVPLFFCCLVLQAQSLDRKIQKSWIKISIENLSPKPIDRDTLYTRYSFARDKVDISFSPAWHGDYTFDWSLKGNSLMVGYDTYVLEELTDSTLIFSKDKFRRFRFASEAMYSTFKGPDTTARYNEQPVYLASSYLTPRYKKEKALDTYVNKELDKIYDIKHAHTFIARFIVTGQGKIERIQVVNSVTPGFDNDVIKLIKKTSGDWFPAKIDNAPVNCEITFMLRYLDSFVPNLKTLDGRIEL